MFAFTRLIVSTAAVCGLAQAVQIQSVSTKRRQRGVEKRLMKELKEICNSVDLGVSAFPQDETAGLFNWRGTIEGPADTPYENGEFKLQITIPENYPFQAPKVEFLTKIYHCNVAPDGSICLDILKHQWSSCNTILTILLSLRSLLNDPNPDDPLVAEIGKQLKSNKSEHNKCAREWTELYAMGNNTPLQNGDVNMD